MMLMGRAPFAGNSPSEIFKNTCHGRLGLGRGGASLWDKLPPAARELIVGLMQLDHNLRFTGEQAMGHRWLAMPDDPGTAEAADGGAGDGDRETKEGGVATSRGRQQRGGGGGRRRRDGSRKGGRSRSSGSDKASVAAPSRGGVVAQAGGSANTSFATTPSSSSSSGSMPGGGGLSASRVRS